MKEKVAYIISVIFIVPIVALMVLLIMWYDNSTANFNDNIYYLVNSIIFFTVIPTSAYIVVRSNPNLKIGGRNIERKMAFIFALIGYILGNLSLLIMKRPTKPMIIFYLSYLISATILAIINKFFNFKASGHACGITGPILALNFFTGPKMIWMFLLVPLVIWSRVVLKRHDMKQLIVGAAVSFFSTLLIMFAV